MAEEIDECPKCRYPLRSVPCSNCADIKAAKLKRMEFDAIVWGGERGRDTFTLTAEFEGETWKESKRIAESFDPKKHNMFLYGPTGSGKSHLAVAIAKRFYRSGADHYQVFWKLSEITRKIRAADGAAAEQEIINQLGHQRVLILDDVGIEKPSDFTIRTLYEILEMRDMTGRGGLFMTSNLSGEQLQELFGEDRALSRFSRNLIVRDLSGEPDHRPNG